MTKLLKVGSLIVSHTQKKLLALNNLAALTSTTANHQSHRLITTTNLTNQQQPKQSEQKAENFLNGSSAAYIEEVYQSWLADPKSVHKSWDIYFRTSSVQAPPTLGQTSVQQAAQSSSNLPAVASTDLNQILRLLQQMTGQQVGGKPTYSVPSLLPSTPEDKLVEDHLKLYSLIRSYQIRGHKKAALDPLGIGRSLDVTNEKVHDLTPEFYNFTEEDMNRVFKLPKTTFIGGEEQSLTLREILNRLNHVYSRTIGLEYMYINNFDKCNWIRQQFEFPGRGILDPEEKKRTLKRLIRATRFEEFLAKKWSSEKRFGLEGCEVLIPAMKSVIDTVSAKGVDTVIMGN